MKRLLIMSFLFLSCLCIAQEKLDIVISADEISERIKNVATRINNDYKDHELTIIMVMKGAICVTADLIRHLQIPVTLEYVTASSYGRNGTSRGELTIVGLEKLDVAGKHILVVDDIFDTGYTMTTLLAHLQEKNPASLKSLALLVKNVTRHTSYRPEYTLFDIDDHFVVGYGLDYKEHYRQLPGVYTISFI